MGDTTDKDADERNMIHPGMQLQHPTPNLTGKPTGNFATTVQARVKKRQKVSFLEKQFQKSMRRLMTLRVCTTSSRKIWDGKDPDRWLPSEWKARWRGDQSF